MKNINDTDLNFYLSDVDNPYAVDKDGNEYVVGKGGKLFPVDKGSVDPYWGGATKEEALANATRE